jgi:hypothetical protein
VRAVADHGFERIDATPGESVEALSTVTAAREGGRRVNYGLARLGDHLIENTRPFKVTR